MKFLSWMHLKLMQNDAKNMKSGKGNFATFLAEQTLFDEPSAQSRNTWYPSSIRYEEFMSNRYDEASMMELPFQEETLEPFDFLSIGTFGKDLSCGEDPPTPTLAMPSEKISENHLNTMLNYELEKFIEAEEDDDDDAFEKNSIASIITLCNMPIEGTDFEGHILTGDFPLQNYIYANTTEPTEANAEQRFENDRCGHKKHTWKTSATKFAKKLVKNLGSTSRSPVVRNKNGAAASVSIKKKLYKALNILQKKIHAVEKNNVNITMLQKDDEKEHKKDEHCSLMKELDDQKNMVHKLNTTKNGTNMELFSNGFCDDASTTKQGIWMRTDSDYLVLEF